MGIGLPIFTPSIRRTLLFKDRSSPLRIRDCHPLWCGFPANFCSKRGCSPPHLLRIATENSARPCRRSVTLLTGSHWFLFHPVLRYFNSRGCYTPQLPEEYAARSQVHGLRAPTLGLSQLTAGLCGHQPSHPLHGLQHIQIIIGLSFHTHDEQRHGSGKQSRWAFRILPGLFGLPREKGKPNRSSSWRHCRGKRAL